MKDVIWRTVSKQVIVDPELVEPELYCDTTTNSIVLNWNDIDCATKYNVYVDGVLQSA
ncbi:MAG: hypothetical protein R2771_04590 [Saprospiraceae bacterium]